LIYFCDATQGQIAASLYTLQLLFQTFFSKNAYFLRYSVVPEHLGYLVYTECLLLTRAEL